MSHAGARRFARAWFLAAGWLLLIGFVARPVLAHVVLLEASPVPGAVVRGTPREIRLTFNEPLRPGGGVLLYDVDFRPVTGLEPVQDVPVEMLAVRPPALSPGVYTVQWTAIGTDGHPQSGSYSFQIQEQEVTPWLLLIAGLLAVMMGAIVWRRFAKR